MVELYAITLIIISSAEAAISLYILLQDPSNRIKLWFSLFVFSVSIWVGSLGVDLIISSQKGVEIIGYLPWIGGVLSVVTLLFFSWEFPFRIHPISIWHWVAFILPIVVFIILIISPIFSVVEKTQLTTWRTNIKGPSYDFYNVFIFVYLIWAVVNLLIKYRRADGIYRWQLKYFIVGLGINALIVSVTNVFIPWFELASWEPIESVVGPFSTIIWLGFSSYLIFKKNK